MTTKIVKRYDNSRLTNVQKTTQGFLKVPVYAARTGIQTYRMADGSLLREYRPAEEVFSDKSMSSLAGIPITDGHPEESVTSKNAKKLSVGYTSDVVRKIDGKYLATTAIITDSDVIEKIEQGLEEASMGYDVELEFTPGEFEGEPYDAIQRNIDHNHLALVTVGRAGKEVRLRLDSGDAYQVEDAKNTNQERNRMKVKIKDTEFEVPKEVAEAINGLIQDHAAALLEQSNKVKSNTDAADKAKTDAETLQAKVDGLEADLVKAKAESKVEKLDDAAIRKLVVARKKIDGVAVQLLDEETVAKLDEMSDIEVKKAVIKADSKDADLEGKSEHYIEARFDHIAESHARSQSNAGNLGKDINKNRKDDSTANKDEAEVAREKATKAAADAWKQPVGRTK